MMYKSLAFFLTGLLAACSAQSVSAQEMNIVGDTIRVSKSAHAPMTFMYDPEFNKLCEDYGVEKEGNRLIIRPHSSNAKNCILFITEGPSKKKRQHVFIIMYDKSIDMDDQDYDFSTREKILARIDKLKKAKEAAVEKKSGNEPPQPIFKVPPPTVPKNPDPQPVVDTLTTVKPPAPSKRPPSSRGPNPPGEMSREEALLRSIPEKELNNRVELKIKDFYRICRALTNKTNPDPDKAIDLGMKVLFDKDETRKVSTVNSKTGSKAGYPIRQYFNRLVSLGKKYGKVIMTASNIHFVSEFQLGDDGRWHGTAVVIQDFVATNDYNVLAYRDRTEKAIEIILNVFEEVDENGKPKIRFEIYLGNISVTNTPDK